MDFVACRSDYKHGYYATGTDICIVMAANISLKTHVGFLASNACRKYAKCVNNQIIGDGGLQRMPRTGILEFRTSRLLHVRYRIVHDEINITCSSSNLKCFYNAAKKHIKVSYD